MSGDKIQPAYVTSEENQISWFVQGHLLISDRLKTKTQL